MNIHIDKYEDYNQRKYLILAKLLFTNDIFHIRRVIEVSI